MRACSFRFALAFSLSAAALWAAPGWGQERPAERQAQGRQGARQRTGPPSAARLLERFDKNKDKVLDKSEIPPQLRQRLATFDADQDGKLTAKELEKLAARFGGRGGRRQGETITGPARGERHATKLKVGDAAPDFTLPDPTGKREVTLSSFQGKKPVVLIFGSYT